MMKWIILFVAMSGFLTGCVVFTNRVACTVARDEAVYVSKYGQIGIASVIDERDAAVICAQPGAPAK